MSYTVERRKIEGARDALFKNLTGSLTKAKFLAVVKAPPGSGKTRLLVDVAACAHAAKARVAVATQTNSQADEVCRRLSNLDPPVPSIRFLGNGGDGSQLPAGVRPLWAQGDLPRSHCVVVATTAKWEFTRPEPPFNIVFVDEAWQMPWARFMGLGNVAERFVLIGDPGQIPPVVPVDASRWETAPRPPHHPAPELILRDETLAPVPLQLPASWRLPHDTVEVVRGFYDFPFGSYSGPGERSVRAGGRSRDAVDKAIDLLAGSTIVGVNLPCPDGGPPIEVDEDIAEAAVQVARRLLERETDFVIEDGTAERMRSRLLPGHIGITATHRVMNARIAELLPATMKQIGVDTPERWQGLERPVMIMVHPLSGVVEPSSFDLETGRLCVMASRHSAGLVVLSRDHVRSSLDELTPSADQAVGRPDVNGRGHAQHLSFWRALEEPGRIVSVA